MNSADLAPLEREQRAALARILSPSELEEFDLRSSRTGQSMRSELSSFNPTEEEFRAIFRLRQAHDERFGPYTGILGQEQMRERTDERKQLTAQINSLLGPARGAEYERAIDSNFRQTSQLVARYQLPPETAANLWQAQKEFEKRRTELYTTVNGSGLTPTERAQNLAGLQPQLNALQQETLTRVTSLLGDATRLDAYRQYGGSWLQSLTPRPRPAN